MSARIVRLPNVPPKGDVSDFLNAGGTVEELERLAEAAPEQTQDGATQEEEAPAAKADATPGGRSSLLIDDFDLLEMTAEAWRAVEADGDIYRFGTALGWVVTAEGEDSARTQLLTRHQLRYRLAERIQFLREAGKVIKPAFPPETLVSTMLNVPPPSLPRLLRVVHAPIFAADGRLLQTPGYDAASGVYLALRPGLDIPPVPSAPAPADVAEARRWLLEELLGDVRFAGDADRANAVGMLLTLVLREMIRGNVPLFAFSKPQPRSGATLVVQLLTLIVLGDEAEPTRATPDKNEMEKKLLAILEGTPEVVFFDNAHGRLNNETLAMVLTSPTFLGRRLQYTQIVRVPVRATFCITGNNLEMSNELTARSVYARIDPKTEKPWERRGFRHPRIREWARENRGQLLWAALTLGQAWIAAGRPTVVDPSRQAFGGFEEWEAALGGALKVAGISGFRENQAELFERMDQESAPTREFLAKWWDAFTTTRRSVKELYAVAQTVDDLPIEGRDDRAQRTRLGLLPAREQDRPFTIAAGLTVKIVRGGKEANAILWRLEPIPAEPPAGEQGGALGEPTDGGEGVRLSNVTGDVTSNVNPPQVSVGVGENDGGVRVGNVDRQSTRARVEIISTSRPTSSEFPSGDAWGREKGNNPNPVDVSANVSAKLGGGNPAGNVRGQVTNPNPPRPCGRFHGRPLYVDYVDYAHADRCPCQRCCAACNTVQDAAEPHSEGCDCSACVPPGECTFP